MSKLKAIWIGVLAGICLVSCSRDELTEQGSALPDGAYPITFSAAQVAPEVAPQTRVVDNGNVSSWTAGDQIMVTVNHGSHTQESTCTLDADGNITTYSPPLYFQSTDGTHSINAWYYSNFDGQATTSQTVSLADQTNKLAYVMKADQLQATYATAPENIRLTFHHQLAKVRVVPMRGNRVGEVKSVRIKSFTECTHTNGGNIQGSNEDWITMKACNYNGIGKCWEANVVPNEPITELEIELDETKTVELAKEFKPVAGKVNKIDLGVGQYTVKLADVQGQMYTVDPGANVIIDGEGKESNKKISIPGGNGTTVTLKNCRLNNKSDYNHHNIQVNGDATIILSGTNQIFGLSHGTVSVNDHRTALYVSNKATLTIQAEDDRGELYIESGNNGKFVGALALAGGALVIESGKITSVVKSSQSFYPGIGNTSADCGTITINGGEITATVQGSSNAPGIGSNNGWKCEGITINGGTVTVQGGNNSDYDISPGNEWAITDVPVNIENDATVKRPDGNPVRIYGQEPNE